MAKSYIKFDSSNLWEMLDRYEQAKAKSIALIVRKNARICAVELANRTQPFTSGPSTGAAVLKKGKERLQKDILKPVKDQSKLQEKADGLRNAKLRARLQSLVVGGSNQSIAFILKIVKTISSVSNFKPAGKSDVKSAHRSHRSKSTGHSLSASPDYNYSPKSITPYINEVSKMIGYTKSGWSEAAKKIGGLKGDGARGIPAFAKRQKKDSGTAIDNSKSKSNPNFHIINKVPWVSKMLKESEKNDGVNYARKLMEVDIYKLLKAVSKQKANVESVTAEILAE